MNEVSPGGPKRYYEHVIVWQRAVAVDRSGDDCPQPSNRHVRPTGGPTGQENGRGPETGRLLQPHLRRTASLSAKLLLTLRNMSLCSGLSNILTRQNDAEDGGEEGIRTLETAQHHLRP